MWTIRQEQLEKFRQASLNRFEELMVEHLNKFFPARCQAMGEPRVREVVRYGVQRAKGYGITEECDVSVFLDVMFVMGRDFDLQRENAWAVRILNETRGTSSDRVMELRSATLQQLRSKKEANAEN